MRSSIKTKVTVGVMVALTLLFAAYALLHDRHYQFNSDSWKQGNARTRAEMVQSLCSQSLLQDKRKDEVTGLLGKPDESNESVFKYHLNFRSRIIGAPMFLKIGFIESKVWRIKLED